MEKKPFVTLEQLKEIEKAMLIVPPKCSYPFIG